MKKRMPLHLLSWIRALSARGARGLFNSGILSTAPARLTVLSAFVLSALIVLVICPH